jgi:hypothetical protein
MNGGMPGTNPSPRAENVRPRFLVPRPTDGRMGIPERPLRRRSRPKRGRRLSAKMSGGAVLDGAARLGRLSRSCAVNLCAGCREADNH